MYKIFHSQKKHYYFYFTQPLLRDCKADCVQSVNIEIEIYTCFWSVDGNATARNFHCLIISYWVLYFNLVSKVVVRLYSYICICKYMEDIFEKVARFKTSHDKLVVMFIKCQKLRVMLWLSKRSVFVYQVKLMVSTTILFLWDDYDDDLLVSEWLEKENELSHKPTLKIYLHVRYICTILCITSNVWEDEGE